MYKRSKGTILELFKRLSVAIGELGWLAVLIITAMKVVEDLVVLTSTAMLVFCWVYMMNGYKATKDFVSVENVSFLWGVFRLGKKAEKWTIALGWWIPRKYRGAIVGDILEDCHEMRETGCGEWRIRIQVIWQWVIAVGTSVPATMIAAVWRIVSPSK